MIATKMNATWSAPNEVDVVENQQSKQVRDHQDDEQDKVSD